MKLHHFLSQIVAKWNFKRNQNEKEPHSKKEPKEKRAKRNKRTNQMKQNITVENIHNETSHERAKLNEKERDKTRDNETKQKKSWLTGELYPNNAVSNEL